MRCHQVYSTIGAFVVLDENGWIVTSAHLVDEIIAAQKMASGEIEGEDDKTTVADVADLWALPGFGESRPEIAEVIVRPIADLALVRLQRFDGSGVGGRPVLRDISQSPVEVGMSVCRLGYPFYNIAASWDESAQEFRLPPGTFPVPSFALDGMVSRFRRVAGPDGASASFIETSTPGLRGQSGGPLIDIQGRICGIQSHTAHLDLGFDAHFSAGDEVVSERQFLNVGAATWIGDLVALLDEANIAYDLG
jgi:S1-C subfamily serine protease